MNKLTEIKQRSEENYYASAVDGMFSAHEAITYLISLLEEKDKALAFYADEKNYFRKPQDQLTFIEADFGKLARKALNTSSNNEGE